MKCFVCEYRYLQKGKVIEKDKVFLEFKDFRALSEEFIKNNYTAWYSVIKALNFYSLIFYKDDFNFKQSDSIIDSIEYYCYEKNNK